MCLRRYYLSAGNKQHWLKRVLSHSLKPHSFRALMKDNLIKIPFFHVNQLTSARAFSGDLGHHSVLCCCVVRLGCGLVHISAQFWSRFQGITWGRNHSQYADEGSDIQSPTYWPSGSTSRGAGAVAQCLFICPSCWTALPRPAFCYFPGAPSCPQDMVSTALSPDTTLCRG